MKSQTQSRIIRSVWLFLCLVAGLGSAASVHAEMIRSFSAVIEVQENGDLLVREKIMYDFGTNERHGIYRNVTDSHPQAHDSWFQTRYVEPVFESVTRDGSLEQYSVDSSYGGMSVRVGDPQRIITGLHEYDIAYRVEGAMGIYGDKTELYWNMTGREWAVPIEDVSITLRAVEGVSLLPAVACYSEKECVIEQQSEEVTYFSARNLAPGQQVTFAQELSLPEEPEVLQHYNLWLIIPIVLGAALLLIAYFIYRWKTKYRPNQAIVAQYEPYGSFAPMFTGVLFDNRLDSRDITAGIVYLAQQGFLKIKQRSEKVFGLFEVHDYDVTLLRSLAEADTHFQRDLLRLLFAGQASVKEVAKQKGFLGFKFTRGKDADVIEVGKTVRLSDIKMNQPKLRANARLIQLLKKSAKEDLFEKGYLEKAWQRRHRTSFGGGTPTGFFLFVFGILGVWFVLITFFPILFFVLVAFVMLLSPVLALERRTEWGYEALYHLKGFKDFLSVTEKERYAFHNAPSKSPEQFMAYLSYAIAFGVEEEWAEVFQDIQIEAPDWYQSDVAGSHFSAVALSSEIGAFSGSLASSGGSSGSSGGGSAGGGGGGGGGGSW